MLPADPNTVFQFLKISTKDGGKVCNVFTYDVYRTIDLFNNRVVFLTLILCNSIAAVGLYL